MEGVFHLVSGLVLVFGYLAWRTAMWSMISPFLVRTWSSHTLCSSPVLGVDPVKVSSPFSCLGHELAYVSFGRRKVHLDPTFRCCSVVEARNRLAVLVFVPVSGPSAAYL